VTRRSTHGSVGRPCRSLCSQPVASEYRDLDDSVLATIEAVRPFTMTSPERINALCEAVRYVVRNGIPGAFVECGVWRGGSAMAAVRTLLECGDAERSVFLFDTFEGMTPPSEFDRDIEDRAAGRLMESEDRETSPVWAYASLDEVRANLAATGYPMDHVRFVEGPVEETIPSQAPASVAILRLDTDWYESTRHELEHLVDRVSPGGVLIIDDYGHWQGARRAVDEFLARTSRPVLLNRVDYTGRIAVLP